MKKHILIILVVISITKAYAQVTVIDTISKNDSIFSIFLSDSSHWKAYEGKENPMPVYGPAEGEQPTVEDENGVEVSLGFIFAPQGIISLQYPRKGFIGVTPIIAAATFSKEKNSLKVTYNLTHNKAQIVYLHSFTDDIGGYFLFNKFIFDKGGYMAFALTKSLGKGKASLFCEMGTTWNKWAPVLCTGVLIPFSFKIN